MLLYVLEDIFLEDIFFPNTISILRTTEEFMPIKFVVLYVGESKA